MFALARRLGRESSCEKADWTDAHRIMVLAAAGIQRFQHKHLAMSNLAEQVVRGGGWDKTGNLQELERLESVRHTIEKLAPCILLHTCRDRRSKQSAEHELIVFTAVKRECTY